MDTKEQNRRASSRKRPTQAPKQRSGSAARRSSSGTRRQERRTPRPTAAPQTRQAPRQPREEIPEVVYTSPKPLRRGRFLLRLVSVVAVVAAIMMCLSVFFKVETITVSGAEKYTPWMIREASGIQEGDSLLGLSKAKAASRILSQLRYVDEVRIGINLPGTVNIEIKELEVVYAIQASDNTWWLISSDGNVVEKTDAASASGYTKIIGVQVDAPRVGQTVQAPADSAQPQTTEETGQAEATASTPAIAAQSQETNAQRLQTALTILQELENNGVIGMVASVNVSSLTELTLEYEQRIHVVLGDTDRLAYKIGYMAQAIDQLEDYETGELDVSFRFFDEALFDPAD